MKRDKWYEVSFGQLAVQCVQCVVSSVRSVSSVQCGVQCDESSNIIHHHQLRPAPRDFADQASLQTLRHSHPHLIFLKHYLSVKHQVKQQFLYSRSRETLSV